MKNLNVATKQVAQNAVVITPIMTANTIKKPSVSIDIAGAAKAYKGLVKQAGKSLLVLRSIGEVLNAIRSDFESNTLYGKHLATTELSIMSRQDRNDAQWLATKWDAIQAFKADNDLSTNSVGVLRKLMGKAIKENAEGSTEGGEGEGSGEAGEGIVKKQLDIVELTEFVLELVAENGLTTKALIKALQTSLKA